MDEGPPVADLHLHTTTSNDRLTISTLPDTTRAGEVDVVTVMDHDRYHPELDAPVAERDGATIVRGIELHVGAGDRRVNLLGYGLRERPALVETAEQPWRNRIERMREIVAAIEEEAGARLEVDIHDGVGRSYVARAIDASEAPYDYQGAFDELIGADGPCYVTHELPTLDDDVVALRDTCDMVGLARSFRYRGPADALELCADLDAVGRHYPYGFDVEVDPVEEVVERYGLFATGRSDAYDETLGCTGSPETDFAQFAAAIDGL